MTSTLILQAIQAYIAFKAAALGYTELAALPVSIDGDASQLEPPLIYLTCSGTNEHEVLRGVYDLGITAAIVTVPRDEEGETVAENHTLENQFYEVLADTESLVAWSDANNTTSKIFNARDFDLNTEADDNQRASIITFLVVGCKI